jgi:hypothetical protein
MGDFNAQIGKGRNGYETIMKPQVKATGTSKGRTGHV